MGLKWLKRKNVELKFLLTNKVLSSVGLLCFNSGLVYKTVLVVLMGLKELNKRSGFLYLFCGECC